jgi:hypothetical protein
MLRYYDVNKRKNKDPFFTHDGVYTIEHAIEDRSLCNYDVRFLGFIQNTKIDPETYKQIVLVAQDFFYGDLPNEYVFAAYVLLQELKKKHEKDKQPVKVITFHSTVRRSKVFQMILDILSEKYFKQFSIGFLAVDGETAKTEIYDDKGEKVGSSKSKEEFLTEFNDVQKNHIMSLVNVFGEGVDIKECNGVVFMDKKKEPIGIIQNIGRCLRTSTKQGKDKKSTVWLPCALPKDMSKAVADFYEKEFLNDKYKHVLSVLRQIGDADKYVKAGLLQKEGGKKLRKHYWLELDKLHVDNKKEIKVEKGDQISQHNNYGDVVEVAAGNRIRVSWKRDGNEPQEYRYKAKDLKLTLLKVEYDEEKIYPNVFEIRSKETHQRSNREFKVSIDGYNMEMKRKLSENEMASKIDAIKNALTAVMEPRLKLDAPRQFKVLRKDTFKNHRSVRLQWEDVYGAVSYQITCTPCTSKITVLPLVLRIPASEVESIYGNDDRKEQCVYDVHGLEIGEKYNVALFAMDENLVKSHEAIPANKKKTKFNTSKHQRETRES